MAVRSHVFISARLLTLVLAFALFVGFCALPTLYMIGASFFGSDGKLTLDNYRRILVDARQRDLLHNSVLLAGGASALATCLGAPLGFLLARSDVPLKRFFRLALVIPLVIPPEILALAWIYFGGPAGSLVHTASLHLVSGWTYSLAGAILVLGVSFYPLAMLATEAGARRVEPALEESALLAASPQRVFWRITLPLIAPVVAAAAIVIFVLALCDFAVPGLLRVRVFTTEIFTAFAALYDFGAATALATPLVIVALIAGTAVTMTAGTRILTTRRGSRDGLQFALHRFRIVAAAGVALLIAVTVVLPLCVLALEAGRLDRITNAAYESSDTILTTLLLASAGATLIVALGAFLGYAHARARPGRRRYLELALIAFFAVPSTVVGIGLIGLWNRTGLLAWVYSSPLIIILAFAARYLPLASLMLGASVRQVPVSFEEAAQIASASWTRTLTHIILPQIRTGLAAAWVVVFIFASGELGATLLVAPPGTSTLSVRIYTLIANSPSSQIAALALVHVAILFVPLGLFMTLLRRERSTP